MKKKSKQLMVEEYIIANGSISSLEAIVEFWATRLSAIIYTLKSEGWVFETTRETHEPSGCHFARYHLVSLPPNY